MDSRISIIGAGRVGTAIALSLQSAGFRIVGVASKSITGAAKLAHKVGCTVFSDDPCEVVVDSDVVFITTPDREIAGVCEKIGHRIGSGALAIHTSGALTSEILRAIKVRGAQCLSMHPCQSFSNIAAAPERLAGSYFCLEGEDEAVRRGEALAKAMNCHSFVLRSSEKLLYHVACSLVSNYLVVLVEKALSTLKKTGLNNDEALKIMTPLLDGTLENIKDLGVEEALTGPIERGEVEILRKHMEIIENRIPDLMSMYQILAREAIRIAAQKGKLSAEVENRLSEILQ